MTTKKLTVTLSVAAVLVAACSSGTTSSAQKQSGPLSVGVIAPFTGPAAQFGKLLSAPCYAGTKLINDAGGVLGHQLNCVSIDDTGDPACRRQFDARERWRCSLGCSLVGGPGGGSGRRGCAWRSGHRS